MKKIFILIAFLLGNITLYSQTFYEGKLGALTFGLETDTVKKTALLYIPEQGMFAYNAQNPVFSNDSLKIELKAFGVVLSGKLDAQTFDGQWKQSGFPAPVKLQKVAALSFLKRPQHPVTPFSYLSENITFGNADNTIRFGGTLTLPKGKGPFKAVVLISGSGQQDRDETLFGHKPFWVIADHLTRQGIAVLRVDDRGMGETTGELGTSADYAQDVLAAVAYLKTRSEVNKKKIGLIGHSEGGLIAPLVAVKSKDVAFVVSLAGLGVNGTELLLQQSDDILKQTGITETFRGHYKALNTLIYSKAASLTPTDDIGDSLKKVVNTWAAQQPTAILGQMGFGGEAGKKQLTNAALSVSNKWFRYFLAYDPLPTLAKVKIPVLALNGSKDVQVAAKQNLAGFEKGLTAAGNKNFKTIELEGLNHLFQKCQKCTANEYGLLEETFSVEALNIMTDWLKEQ
jgi:uncharacterized protein